MTHAALIACRECDELQRLPTGGVGAVTRPVRHDEHALLACERRRRVARCDRSEGRSLAAIVAGGIAFQAPADLPPESNAPADTEFILASDRATAMRHAETEVLTFQLYFKETLRGLTAGAPVDFHGITLGEVRSVDLEFDPDSHLFRTTRWQQHKLARSPR